MKPAKSAVRSLILLKIVTNSEAILIGMIEWILEIVGAIKYCVAIVL